MVWVGGWNEVWWGWVEVGVGGGMRLGGGGRRFWHEGVEGGSGVCVLGGGEGGGRRFWLNRWNEVLLWGVRMGFWCGGLEWGSGVGG